MPPPRCAPRSPSTPPRSTCTSITGRTTRSGASGSWACALEEAGSGEAGADLELGYDQPPFTALHGAAHAWLGPRLFAMRWMYEGLASHYAAAVAPELGIEAPYDPAAERDALADV